MSQDQFRDDDKTTLDDVSTAPLPGVKAEDPDTGVADPHRSDDEVEDELESRPDVDSGDGVVPEPGETRDDTDPADDVGEIPFTPFHPAREDL